MAPLKENVKIYIVQQLAMFRQPQEIVEAVKENFGIAVSRPQVFYYHPDQDKTSKKFKRIFADARARFLKEINEIPISNEAYRMRQLQKSLDRVVGNRVINEPLVLNILEQAAKERGKMFTNRREITGANGKSLFDPVELARSVMQELVANGMEMSEAIQFVVDRYKISEAQVVSEANN